MRCAVNKCGNNNRYSNRSKCRYFHFPKEATLLKKWIDFCERDKINPATACICNEHFAPEDFEINMQYEMGFTRKNPTKLRPGSYPTSKGPQKLSTKMVNKSANEDPTGDPPFLQENAKSPIEDVLEVVEAIEEGDILEDLVEVCDQSSSESGDSTNNTDHRHLEVQTLDPSNQQPTENDYVDIIDSEDDTYVKYLEHEVCSLKREVVFLKTDRKKLLDEIQNLRDSIQSSQLPKNMDK